MGNRKAVNAQNDSERAQGDSIVGFFRSLFSPALPAASNRGKKSALRHEGNDFTMRNS